MSSVVTILRRFVCKPPSLCVLFASLVLGCSNDSSNGNNSTSDSDPRTKIEWTSCPLDVDQPSGRKAECATVFVPLDWRAPEDEKIQLFVQRLRGRQSEGKKHLWLLHGGPDHSAPYSAFQDMFTRELPDLDVYMLDHRGTGRSTRFECPGIELGSPLLTDNEIDDCIEQLTNQWQDGISQFTTTAAARDVLHLMDAVSEGQNTERYLYGLSYGTLWAQRLLQIAPDAVDGLIIEGVASPARGYESANDAAITPFNNLLALCDQDPFCASQLGGDTGVVLDALVKQAQNNGHCSAIFGPLADAGLTPAEAVKVILWALMELGGNARPVIPAFIARLSRCSTQDIAAVMHLTATLMRQSDRHLELPSSALFYHIHLTTYWNQSERDCGTLLDAETEKYRVFSTVPRTLCRLQRRGWPIAPGDDYEGKFPISDVPTLILNGELDIQTAIEGAKEVATHLNAPSQYFSALPRTGHCTLIDSPVNDESSPTCGVQLALSFLRNPSARPDESCIHAIRPIDFSGQGALTAPDLSAYFFGTDTLYE
jgi:pimeloyl-ACP methyl ester carboxylesterase